MRQNFDYGHDVQKLYLEIMLADGTTFVRCQTIFDHTLFDRKLQLAAEFISIYSTEYNSLPTYDIINAATGASLKRPDDLKESSFDWLLAEFETFTLHKGLERAIIESADLLEKGEYGAVEDKIKKAVQIGLQKDIGTDYFKDPKTRLLKIKDRNGQMKTGWRDIDKALYGGVNRGELGIWCAVSGGGKSLFLANLGINGALAGFNVVYITLELSEELVSMRMDSMLTGIPSRDVFTKIDDVDFKVKMIGKKSGTMQIKYMPSGKNTNDIRSYLREYEIKTDRKVDILLVDYLDLLMPNNKKIAADNLFIKDKYVAEELRNLATEKNLVINSAAQFNRTGVDETDFDHSNIAGGLSKIQTADNVFGIYSSKAMRERGLYQIQFLKTRNSSGIGQKVDLDFNVDTLRITDLDAEYDGVITTGSSLLASVQQRSTIVEPNIKPEIGSSKLRNLLNNLPD
jgi:hypothetical protein